MVAEDGSTSLATTGHEHRGRPVLRDSAAGMAPTEGRHCTHLRRVLSSVCLLLLLASCATGNADDANPMATEAAQETNVVAGLEATNVVERFFQPTATPLPYPTRLPVLANLRLTTDVGDQNRPTDAIEVYRRSGPLYAAAQIASLHPGQSVIASWRNGNGDEVFASAVSIQNDRELVWIALQWDGAANAAPGEYAVHILVEGPGTTPDGEPGTVRTPIGSIAFTVQ